MRDSRITEASEAFIILASIANRLQGKCERVDAECKNSNNKKSIVAIDNL